VDEVVVVKTVADPNEAEIVVGLLRSAGIECGYRETDRIDSNLEDFTRAGQQEILVHPKDLEDARALLEPQAEA
jgi:putative signal transducing protein